MNQDKRVTSLLTEFGLTPSSMSRLRGLDKKQEKNDPFADLLNQ
jgi:phage terminase small subunit